MKDLSYNNQEVEVIAKQYQISEHKLKEYLDVNCVTMKQNVDKAYQDIRAKVKGDIILVEEILLKKKNPSLSSQILKSFIDSSLPVLILTDDYGDYPSGFDVFSFYRRHGFKPIVQCANGTLMLYFKE